MESDNNYESVYITIQLTENLNQLLSESCFRSKRKKIQEAALRLEDHLRRYKSISEINVAVDYHNNVEVNHVCTSHF